MTRQELIEALAREWARYADRGDVVLARQAQAQFEDCAGEWIGGTWTVPNIALAALANNKKGA